MYYSNGNYEAFARPKKPEHVEQKSAYLIGSGLASLAAACFLIRDGQMDGSNIHILEELPKSGGSLDGTELPMKGYVMRGGREWRTISSVYGIYFAPSHHLKLKMLQF